MPDDPRNERARDPSYEDYLAERDFELRYGRRDSSDLRHDHPASRFSEPRSWWNRASDELSSWFGDPDAMRRRQWDQAAGDQRGKGPKVTLRAEARILDDINDRLTDDPHLDATDVEVAVANGEVTLNGRVATKADKRRAEDIAESSRGVIQVRNNLRIS
jgi:osmotically-inducible protein OsmY